MWNSLKHLPMGQICKVCKLERSIYGLKQLARLWNKWLDERLKEIGIDQTHSDHCVYINKSTSIIVAIWVHDYLARIQWELIC